jgi:bifunctional non-homologous end joining protein LigD
MINTTKLPEKIILFYKEGGSDKEYRVELRCDDANNDQWNVFGYNGRRGGALKEQKKTLNPVSYEEGKKIYDDLVKSKVKGGYTADNSGTPYNDISSVTNRDFSGFVPQLLNYIRSETEIEEVLNDPRYCAQQKYDGERRPIIKAEDLFKPLNKEGLVTNTFQEILDDIAKIGKSFLLDSEEVSGKLYVFDLLELNGNSLKELTYAERYKELQKIFKKHDFKTISLVETAFSTSAKKELFERVKNNKQEGVVFKRHDAPYAPSRPASGGSQVKVKFTEVCSVIVTKKSDKKRSVHLGALKDGNIVDIGKVSIPVNHDVPDIGNIVNVEYLYWFKDGKLFQPVYKSVRTDQSKPDEIEKLKVKQDEQVDLKSKKLKIN